MFAPRMTRFASTPYRNSFQVRSNYVVHKGKRTSLHGSYVHAQQKRRGHSQSRSLKSLSPDSHETRSLSSCARPPKEAPQSCGCGEARKRKRKGFFFKKRIRRGSIRTRPSAIPGQTMSSFAMQSFGFLPSFSFLSFFLSFLP